MEVNSFKKVYGKGKWLIQTTVDHHGNLILERKEGVTNIFEKTTS